MNEHEVERLAAMGHALRPDWPVTSLRTLISKKLGDRPRRDVAVALAWIACEPNTATPARVIESGPWWKAAGVEGNLTYRPPRADEMCRRHGDYADACSGCHGDRLAGDSTPNRTTDRGDASAWAADIRETWNASKDRDEKVEGDE